MKSKLTVFATIALSIHYAHGAPITWADIAGNTNWNTGTSWVGLAAPADNIDDDVAIFEGVTNAQPNLPLGTGSRSVNGIDFRLPAGGVAFTSAAGALLKLGGTGIDATTQLSGTNTVSVESIQINGDETWTLFSGTDDPSPTTSTSTFSVSSNIDLNGNALTVRSNRNSTSGNVGIVNLSGIISGSANLTLSSPSASRNTINLTGNSSYSGTTTIQQVAVTANSLANATSNSALGSSGTIILGSTSGFARLTFQDLTTNGSTDRLLSLKGTATSAYTLANNDADNTIAFTNGGNTGDASVSTANNLIFTLGGSNTGDNTFGQVINDRTGGGKTILRKADAGTWVVTNSNSYSGGTDLNAGKLLIAQGSSLGSAGVTLSGNATLGATAALTLANNIDLGTFTGTFTNTAATTAEVFEVTGLITGTGAVVVNTGSFAKGTVRFSNNANSYSGNFSALPGTCEFTSVADAGSNSSLGAGSAVILGNNSASVVFRYVGSTVSTTNRSLDWKTTTGIMNLASSGIGTVSYLAPGDLRSGSGNATLQLRGTNTGDNTLAQVINDSGGVTSVTKLEAGKWILNGANTYTGDTTVNAGTLKLGANNVLPDGSAVTIGAATMDGDTRTDTAGTLDVTAAATINLGSGAALAFAASNAVDWTGGTLNITGTLAPTSLRFGTTSGGLSTGQLAVISVNGSGLGTYTLDPSGYLVPGSSSPYDTWAGGPGLPFDGDANGDGVSNGLAFLLGAANKDENAINKLPTVTQSGGNLVLNFNCLPVSARGGVTFKVENGTNLASWTATTGEVPDATNAVPDNNVTFVVGAGPVGPPALNSVQATIDSAAAAGGGKLFGRLKAVNP